MATYDDETGMIDRESITGLVGRRIARVKTFGGACDLLDDEGRSIMRITREGQVYDGDGNLFAENAQ